MRPGQLLVATPLIVDPNFSRTVVYLFGDDDGPAGVVLNRPSELPVTEVLPGWDRVAASPPVVHYGGPVAVEHAIALGSGEHREMVAPGLGLIDLEADPDTLAPDSARIFAGYAGWSASQLEHEIAEHSWFVLPGTVFDVLDPEPQTLWRRVLARQPDDVKRFATYPEDPGLN